MQKMGSGAQCATNIKLSNSSSWLDSSSDSCGVSIFIGDVPSSGLGNGSRTGNEESSTIPLIYVHEGYI